MIRKKLPVNNEVFIGVLKKKKKLNFILKKDFF